MQLEVLEKEDCEKLNMGCYLAVAACSAEPPKFIHLTYKPKGRLKLSPCGCILWMHPVDGVSSACAWGPSCQRALLHARIQRSGHASRLC